MKKIIQYKLIFEDRSDEFELEINRAIKLGWQPLGGVCHTTGGYFQGMVKYEIYKQTAGNDGYVEL